MNIRSIDSELARVTAWRTISVRRFAYVVGREYIARMALPQEDSQPDPLPATLPGGTRFSTRASNASGEVTDRLLLKDGVYRGRARMTYTTGQKPHECEARVFPEFVDWRSYRLSV